MWIVLLVLFIGIVGFFAYMDTRKGMDVAFPYFLRVTIPMLLAGIIVRIIQLMGELGNLKFVIAGIATVIFYIVFVNIFKKKKRESNRLKIYQYFVGLFLGLMRGWLYFGFAILYLNLIFGTGLFPAGRAQNLVNIITKPVNWLMFLEFLG